ncbi:GFA family protein [Lysobacter sp. P5_B9]
MRIEGKSKAWIFDGATPVPYRTCAGSNGIANSPADVVTSHFCPECGSTVYYFRKSDPARTGVRVGAFADNTFRPPMGSGFEQYAHPWAMNVSALPMPLGHHQ